MKVNDSIALYLKRLQTLGRSYYTSRGARYGLKDLTRFLAEEKITEIEDLNPDVLTEYQEDLAFRLTAKGSLLALRSQSQLLGVVKSFTRFLKEKDYLIHDPAETIKLPKKPRRLPKVILSAKEVQQLLEAPDRHTNRGYRNRIIVEILYDTAIRRSEIAAIKVTDLDLDSGYIQIHGKGDKDRIVPLSQRVCGLVRNYIIGVRPDFITDKDNDYLILNRWGKKMGEGLRGRKDLGDVDHFIH